MYLNVYYPQFFVLYPRLVKLYPIGKMEFFSVFFCQDSEIPDPQFGKISPIGDMRSTIGPMGIIHPFWDIFFSCQLSFTSLWGHKVSERHFGASCKRAGTETQTDRHCDLI